MTSPALPTPGPALAWLPWSPAAKAQRRAAAALVTTVTAVARQPDLFGPNGAPDTLAGRLEALYAHAALALIRLRADPAQGATAQLFADRLFRTIDAGLREAGVGDLSVPKKMKSIAQAFYGRAHAYAAGLDSPDPGALTAAVARNFGLDASSATAGSMAARLRGLAARQAGLPAGDLARLDAWAPPAAA